MPCRIPKKIAMINDIAGYGRCSATESIPIISAMKVQVCPVPTSLFSNHTGFPVHFMHDCTPYLRDYLAKWKELGFRFDGIYCGFLGRAEQIGIVQEFLAGWPDVPFILDPVMGDHGKAYRTVTPEHCEGLKFLLSRAAIITPNITEACLLTGLEYRETHDDSYIRTLLERLLALGARTAILTGVRTEPDRVGVACMDAAGAVSQCSAPYVPAVFYGTGDLFASTCAGALTLGWSVHDAMELASAYVADTIAETRREPDARWYGVSFEATIPQLLRRMAQRRPSHAEN